MAVVRLKNINPLGAVYEAAIGRVLEPGEEFEVDESAAGAAASDTDPGHGLLGQLGTNYELVTDTPTTPAPAPVDEPAAAPEPAADPAPEG